jgi:hypothetical protein
MLFRWLKSPWLEYENHFFICLYDKMAGENKLRQENFDRIPGFAGLTRFYLKDGD